MLPGGVLRVWWLLVIPIALTQPTTLYIGGLFGIDTSAGGWNSAGIVPAVKLAFEDINNNSNVLRDYQLKLLIKDSQCNIGQAVRGEIEYISNSKPIIMLLGPGCSKAAMPVAESVHHWNVVQIGFSNSSPLLSKKSSYPLYFRTNPSEDFSNLGRIAILKRFNWKKVAILQQNNDVFTGISNSLVDHLKRNNITVVAYESYKDHPRHHLQNLKQKDARIIFGFFYPDQHYVTFCEAYKQGLYGPKYVWILISGRNEDNWWKKQYSKVDCTPEQVRMGLSNNLGTGELTLSTYPSETISGMTAIQLQARYLERQKDSGYNPVNPFASFGYDAAWASALALNSSIAVLKQQNMSLEDFNYNNSYIRSIFVGILKNMSFPGMSGQIKFNREHDRITKLAVRQIQRDNEERVALFDMATGAYEDLPSTSYYWDGGKVPVDGLTITKKEVGVSGPLFWGITSLCIMGTLMAIGFLSFNIYNRELRYIKMSSPNLNNVIVLGCICVYSSGILFGIDGAPRSEINLTRVCQARLWLSSTGFSLAFGAMFSKTWRVHIIFLRHTHKRVIIRDRQLFGMLVVLLLLDFVFLLTWQMVDPITAVCNTMPLEINAKDDTAVKPFVWHCQSAKQEIWLAVIYAYKGMLLLFGAYLAWETRKVHIPALNDSKLIGVSVYNVIIPCLLITPVLTVLGNNPDVMFVLTSVLTVLCTSVTLILVFVPKIVYLRSNDGNTVNTRIGMSKEPSQSTEQHGQENAATHDSSQ